MVGSKVLTAAFKPLHLDTNSLYNEDINIFIDATFVRVKFLLK